MQNAKATCKPNNGSNYRPIGSYLVEANLITHESLLQALEKQKNSRKRIGDILVLQGHIKRETLDYFVKKIIEPERSQSFEQNLQFNELEKARSNTTLDTSYRQNKILNLPVIELPPQKICRTLFLVVACLVFVGALVQLNASFIEQSASADYAARLFKLDEENNLPTLYSGLALGFCSILLMIISNIKKRVKSIYAKHWQALSWIFVYLAVDEVASIHEILNGLRPILNARGAVYFTWVIPGIILTAIFVLIFWQFIQSLPRKTKNLFILAGSIYVGGAIGLEMLGGYFSELYGQDNFIYPLISTIEEFSEMFGIVIFIYALLSYIAKHIEVVNLRVCFNRDQSFKKS